MQLKVLQWIGDGCPDGVMSGYTYKTTAVALQNRRLVEVSKRGGGWNALITDSGRYYLEHGRFPSVPPRVSPQKKTTTASISPKTRTRPHLVKALTQPSKGKRSDASPQKPSPTEQLIIDIQAAGGTLRIPDTYVYGKDWRELVGHAKRWGKVPKGKRLESDMVGRFGARDVELRLIDAPPGTEVETRPVPVPQRVSRLHPTAVKFRDESSRHEVSAAALSRTVRIVHALATEAQKRGYSVAIPDPRNDKYGDRRWSAARHGHLEIQTITRRHRIRIREAGVPTRHGWRQSQYREKKPYPKSGSGRLKFEIDEGHNREGRPTTWSDRANRSLEDQLPELLRELEIRSAEDAHTKKQKEKEEQRRRQRWEVAMQEAKQRLHQHERATHLHQQAQDWAKATQIRRYLTAMEEAVSTIDDEQQRSICAEWLEWSRTYVEALDPLNTAPVPPPMRDPEAEELKPFLKGWSPYGPDSYR